jgi:MFS family permease
MATTDMQQNIIRKTLRNSVFDGVCHSAMLGLTQSYVVPFALALKATTAQVGLLSSLPSLVMAFSQLAAPRLTRKAGSRKRLILPVVLVHALMWIPVLLIPYLFPGDKVWWLIGLMTLSAVFGSLALPAWGSMMADLVPENTRGRYFGWRSRICDFTMLVISFVAGGILQWTTGNPFLGFSIIFSGAVVSRLTSWVFLSRMHEPLLKEPVKNYGNLPDTIRKLRSSNLGRFIVYVSLVNFATSLAGPFFAVYMLRDLGFDYLTYVAITATATIASVTFLTHWGKRADRAGNLRVMRITSCIIPLLPLMWLVSKQVYYLIPVQIMAGFAWSGFTLTSSNFLYDASPQEDRTQSIAIFNAMNGLAICFGALAGGFLAPRLPQLLGNSLLCLFLISGILRGFVVILLLRRISEVRRVPKVSSLELLFGKPVLLWVSLRNRLEAVIPPVSSLETGLLPSLKPVTISGTYQFPGASRSPPFFDDS